MFQQPIRVNGKIIVEFKAGRMDWDGKIVTPDKRKGKVILFTDQNEQLMHVQWWDRDKSEMVTDMIVINDAYLQKVERCKTGRVYVLKNTSHNKKVFFWMQEPKEENDAELIKKFNDAIGATIPKAATTPSGMDVDDELQQALMLSMQDPPATTGAPLGSEEAIAKVKAVMADVKTAQHYDKVYKDECVYTFNTPFSDGGLLVNLKTLNGVAADMVELDHARAGKQGALYLVQKFTRVPKEAEAQPSDPSKLAIGVAGGFLEDKFTISKEYSLLAVEPSGARTSCVYPDPRLPGMVKQACEAVIDHQGAASMDNTSRWEADQELKVSKYAKDLVQLPPTKKLSPNPKDWKCEVSGATQNLWLNLSDGHIGGGRKFFDGTGGSNGALDHFKEEKAKGNFYPLVVKLGTITPQGADVYSYAPDEDDMMKDPYLAEHLAHWGIDVMAMEKTDKTLAEMEVDMNLNYDWSRICESGEKLVRVRGPGLVGLKNLGNSCYMNASVQLLMNLPEANKRYADTNLKIRLSAPKEVATDLVAQVAKLVSGLCTARYAPPWNEGDDEDDPKYLVAPQMFRTLVGKGHAEFSSGRQQDASEFITYFFDLLSKAERTALGTRLEVGEPFANMFEFNVEERMQESSGDKRVKYTNLKQNILSLPVKLEDADNVSDVLAFRNAHGEPDPKKARAEGEPEEPRPVIQLDTILKRFAASEDDIPFRGGTAARSQRIASMPRYMLVQLNRYYLTDKWVPTKLECQVPMPESLSLEHLRAKGLQAGETVLPDVSDALEGAAAEAKGPKVNQEIVEALLPMGLTENAARRACVAVQNASAEIAAEWYFQHIEDPDINNPLPAAGGGGGGASGGAGSGPDADPEIVATLASMGFSETQVKAALKSCGNNAEQAADWLLMQGDNLDAAVAAVNATAAAAAATAAAAVAPAGTGASSSAGAKSLDDTPGEYELVGFVSHIGRHTSHGHYVCHLRRPEGWVIFDDQKVAKSEAPPLDLGYVYLYRRKDPQA